MIPCVSVQKHDVRNPGISDIAKIVLKPCKSLRFWINEGCQEILDCCHRRNVAGNLGNPYVSVKQQDVKLQNFLTSPGCCKKPYKTL